MSKETILGIDLGGTNIRGGLVTENSLSSVVSQRVTSDGSVEEVLQEFFMVTDKLFNNSIKAIGIGVPGLVDTEKGIVYDVVNIPSWKEVPLGRLIQERYNVP